MGPRVNSGRPAVRYDDCIVSGVPKNIDPQSLSNPARPVPELQRQTSIVKVDDQTARSTR